MNIPQAAVDAAAKAAYILHSNAPGFDAEAAWDDMGGTEDWERGQWEMEARAALEAALPHMLSHEREQTRLAHVDAVVNAQTVDRLERELAEARAEAWQEGWAHYRKHFSPNFPEFGINPYR